MVGILVCFTAMLLLQLLTPFWWWIVAVPLAYGALRGGGLWESFRTGAISAGGLWLIAALFLLLTSADVVAARVGEMLSIGSPPALVAVTTLVGAVSGGLGGATGFALRDLFAKDPI